MHPKYGCNLANVAVLTGSRIAMRKLWVLLHLPVAYLITQSRNLAAHLRTLKRTVSCNLPARSGDTFPGHRSRTQRAQLCILQV